MNRFVLKQPGTIWALSRVLSKTAWFVWCTSEYEGATAFLHIYLFFVPDRTFPCTAQKRRERVFPLLLCPFPPAAGNVDKWSVRDSLFWAMAAGKLPHAEGVTFSPFSPLTSFFPFYVFFLPGRKTTEHVCAKRKGKKKEEDAGWKCRHFPLPFWPFSPPPYAPGETNKLSFLLP